MLDDVGGPLTRLREMKAPKAEELYEENQMLIKRLEEGRTIFQGLIEGLAVKEQAHPVPKGTSVTGASEHARELGEANDLDGALRKVGDVRKCSSCVTCEQIQLSVCDFRNSQDLS